MDSLAPGSIIFIYPMEPRPHRHPLGDFPAFKWNQICNFLPPNLKGWRVLDIGCNAGFYSFELAEWGFGYRSILTVIIEAGRWAGDLDSTLI